MTYDLSPNQVVKQHPKWIRIKANAPVGICSEVRQRVNGWTGERANEWLWERSEPKSTHHINNRNEKQYCIACQKT